jgi:hypothetical protein
VAPAPEPLHDVELVRGRHTGEDRRALDPLGRPGKKGAHGVAPFHHVSLDSHCARDRFRRPPVVAGEDDRPDPRLRRRPHHLRRVGTKRVAETRETDEGEAATREDDPRTRRHPPVSEPEDALASRRHLFARPAPGFAARLVERPVEVV